MTAIICATTATESEVAADQHTEQAQPAPTWPPFVDPPVYPYEEYVKRYVNEVVFRTWFNETYPD